MVWTFQKHSTNKTALFNKMQQNWKKKQQYIMRHGIIWKKQYGHKPHRAFLFLLAQVSWGVWKVFHHEALASIHTESFLLLCTFYKMACPGCRCRCSWMKDKKRERFRTIFPPPKQPLILNSLKRKSSFNIWTFEHTKLSGLINNSKKVKCSLGVIK